MINIFLQLLRFFVPDLVKCLFDFRISLKNSFSQVQRVFSVIILNLSNVEFSSPITIPFSVFVNVFLFNEVSFFFREKF